LYFKKFERIDWKDDAWVKLIKCPDCGQYWQLDEWDKYQAGLAIKIEDSESWKTYPEISPSYWRMTMDKKYEIIILID
jgi:hypothetical protein